MFLKNKNIIFKIRRSKVTDYAALKKNVNVLPSSALSPSMDPIEHVWDELGRRVRSNNSMR